MQKVALESEAAEKSTQVVEVISDGEKGSIDRVIYPTDAHSERA
jgi:hypothetical protein